MKKIIITILLLVSYLYSHCQIPCGIYGDEIKFKELKQDVKTIKKSMDKISSLKSTHDIARWTFNKENHAQNIQDEMSSYFLSQRVKLKDKNKNEHLNYIHQITVYAMKCKQGLDTKNADKLLQAIKDYEEYYFKSSAK